MASQSLTDLCDSFKFISSNHFINSLKFNINKFKSKFHKLLKPITQECISVQCRQSMQSKECLFNAFIARLIEFLTYNLYQISILSRAKKKIILISQESIFPLVLNASSAVDVLFGAITSLLHLLFEGCAIRIFRTKKQLNRQRHINNAILYPSLLPPFCCRSNRDFPARPLTMDVVVVVIAVFPLAGSRKEIFMLICFSVTPFLCRVGVGADLSSGILFECRASVSMASAARRQTWPKEKELQTYNGDIPYRIF